MQSASPYLPSLGFRFWGLGFLAPGPSVRSLVSVASGGADPYDNNRKLNPPRTLNPSGK